jgi:hypothetical protein
MKILLDMNLPTSWVGFLRQEDFEAIHWSEVGDPRASDLVIMTWAHDNGFVIFTHDLDFSALLAASRRRTERHSGSHTGRDALGNRTGCAPCTTPLCGRDSSGSGGVHRQGHLARSDPAHRTEVSADARHRLVVKVRPCAITLAKTTTNAWD